MRARTYLEMLFTLDPRLESDSTFVINLQLCQVRLHHNAAFPWIILIPHREGISEIIDLQVSDQHLLMEEIVMASHIMTELFQPKKLNIANLGNIVSQLHIHVIARYEYDKAWPQPIWNSGISETYQPDEEAECLDCLKEAFNSYKNLQSLSRP